MQQRTGQGHDVPDIVSVNDTGDHHEPTHVLHERSYRVGNATVEQRSKVREATPAKDGYRRQGHGPTKAEVEKKSHQFRKALEEHGLQRDACRRYAADLPP